MTANANIWLALAKNHTKIIELKNTIITINEHHD